MGKSKENTKTTEGVETPSVDTVQVEMVEKSRLDLLAIENENLRAGYVPLHEEISDLKEKLAKEQEYSKHLEETYSEQIQNAATPPGEDYSYIPLVNIIDGKRVTREEVIADKKLLKLFKK